MNGLGPAGCYGHSQCDLPELVVVLKPGVKPYRQKVDFIVWT